MKQQQALAFENAVRKANPLLLEPIMQIHITVPDEHVGKVIGDLNSRRAQINESTTQDTSDTGRASQSARSVINAVYPVIGDVSIHNTTPLNDTRTGDLHIGIFTLRGGS